MLTEIFAIYKKPFMGVEKGFIPIIEENKKHFLTFSESEDNNLYKISKKGWCPFSPNGSYLKDIEANYSNVQEKYLEKYPEGFHIYKSKEDAIRKLKLLDVNTAKIAEVEYAATIANGYEYQHLEEYYTYKKARIEVALLVRVLNVKEVTLNVH